MRPHRPVSDARSFHSRQRILRVLLTLPLDKWVNYSVVDIEEAFPPQHDRMAFLSRAPQPLRPITTTDQVATFCTQEGLLFQVDPVSERYTFRRRRVPCPACEAIGTILMVDSDYRLRGPRDTPEPMVCGSMVTCIRCKGDAQVAAPREPDAIIMNGERVR